MLARMNREVAHGHVRQVRRELRPLPAAVERDEQPELGADEQQIRVDEILLDDVGVALDVGRSPGSSTSRRSPSS